MSADDEIALVAAHWLDAYIEAEDERRRLEALVRDLRHEVETLTGVLLVIGGQS